MGVWPLIVFILLLLILSIYIILSLKKKRRHEPDYYAFFITGLVWVFIGFIPDNIIFFLMGVLFMIIGLLHKDRWMKNHHVWRELSSHERKSKLWMISLLSFFIAVIIALLLYKRLA